MSGGTKSIPTEVLTAFTALTGVENLLEAYEQGGAVLDSTWAENRAKSLDTLSREADRLAKRIRSMPMGDL